MAWLTKKSWAKIALAVALAAALFVLVGVGSCAVRTGYWLGDLYGGNPLGGEGYRNVTRIPVEGIKNVEIDWAAGSVEVDYGSGDEFSLTETSPTGLTRAQAMRCVVEGDTLKVSYGNGFTGCTGGRAKQLQVSMPRMEGLSLDGASGTYQVSGAVSERLVVSLASGQFKASGADVDVLFLNVASGDASFEGIVRESVQADAASGRIDVTCNLVCPKRFDADFASGTVMLSLPDTGKGFDVQVEKASGSFQSAYDLVDLGGGAYRYKEGAVEGGTSISASLMSGEFILQKTQ